MNRLHICRLGGNNAKDFNNRSNSEHCDTLDRVLPCISRERDATLVTPTKAIMHDFEGTAVESECRSRQGLPETTR